MRGHSALLMGEVTVTLEDVIHILGLQVNGEPVTGRSDSSYQFLVDNCLACFGRQPGPDDHVLGKVNLHWVRRCRDSEPCDTQESIERYVRAHIFCVLGTVVFPDKSTTSLNSNWGAASLAHLYRSLCRASRYNCKEMDGPLILLFVWAWERMPFMAPIPRNQLLNIGVPLARRYCTFIVGFELLFTVVVIFFPAYIPELVNVVVLVKLVHPRMLFKLNVQLY
ncbi:hypothetical protein AHAS_Ahas09G0166500 [Arachis hypogaea]